MADEKPQEEKQEAKKPSEEKAEAKAPKAEAAPKKAKPAKPKGQKKRAHKKISRLDAAEIEMAIKRAHEHMGLADGSSYIRALLGRKEILAGKQTVKPVEMKKAA